MRTLKKALCIVLALVMAVGLLTVAAGAKSLSDYSDANKVAEQYKVAVDVNTQLGVLKGRTDTAYDPQGTLNRAELATIIYRIVTGDVEDAYVKNYADAQRFADVAPEQWFAGYVNYCADNGYLKGVGEGKYDPAGTLTGYQAMAALLRAIGYDKLHEYEGADWYVAVTKDAKKINEGIVADWAKPISREIAAQLAFNTLNAKPVMYIPFLGEYVESALGLGTLKPLIESAFGVTGQGIAFDAEGNPSYQYTGARGKVIADLPLEPVATYTTKVEVCDLLVDAGIAKTDREAYDFAFYANGALRTVREFTHKDLKCEDEIARDGQGVLTNVYDVSDYFYTVDYVVAQTYYYLAQVTDVKADGHGTAGGIKLKVFAGYDNYTVDAYANGDGYKKGDYVIVHPLFDITDQLFPAYLDEQEGFQPRPTSGLRSAPFWFYFPDAWEVVIDQKAETFTGKLEKIVDDSRLQTVVFTIDGKEYDLDIDYYYSVVQANKVYVGSDFTWYFDLFGNLIGDKAPAAPGKQYAVIDRISWWIGGANQNGVAYADIVYMDATKAQVNVTKINDDPTENGDPYGINYDFAPGRISQDWKQNVDWENELYLIKGTTLEEAGTHGRHAAIKNGISTITYTVGFNSKHEIYGNADTVYLYRTGNRNTGYTYTSYTGVNEAPTVNNVDIWYIKNTDRYAEYVFVDVNTDQAQNSNATYLIPAGLQPVARIYLDDYSDVDLYVYEVYKENGEKTEIIATVPSLGLAAGIWTMQFNEDGIYTGTATPAAGYTATTVAAEDEYQGGVYRDYDAIPGYNQFNFTKATIFVIGTSVKTVDPADAGAYLDGDNAGAVGNVVLVKTAQYNAQSYDVAYIID